MGIDLASLSTEELLALKAERAAQKGSSTAKPSGAVPMPAPTINPTESTGEPTSVMPPEGSTDFANVRGNPTPQPPAPPAHPGSLSMQDRYQQAISKMPWYEQVIMGLGGAPAEAYLGVKQLVGGNVGENEIAGVRAAQGTGPGMVGSVAGNVAMLGLPMTRAAQGIEKASRIIPALSNNPNFVRGAAQLGLAGGEGALLHPTMEEESRAGNAAKSAGMTAALGTGGKVLTQAVRPSKSAEALMKQGVQPTISQGAGGAGGKTLGYLEDIVDAMPILNTMVGKSRERAEEELVKIAARRASPYGAAPENMKDITRGPWVLKQDKAFDDGYKDVLAHQTVNMGGGFKTSMRPQIDSALAGADDKVKREVEKVLVKNLQPLGVTTTGPEWHEAFKEVRRAKRAEQDRFAKTSDRDAEKAIEAYRAVEKGMIDARNKALKGTNDEGLIERLTNLDEAYAHFNIFKSAAENAKAGGESGVKLEHLIKAVEDNTPVHQLIRAQGRLQDLTEPAKTVFEKSMGSSKDALQRRIANVTAGGVLGMGAVGTGTLAAIPALTAASTALAFRPISKLAFGNTGAQRYMARNMRNRMGAAGASIPIGTNDTVEE